MQGWVGGRWAGGCGEGQERSRRRAGARAGLGLTHAAPPAPWRPPCSQVPEGCLQAVNVGQLLHAAEKAEGQDKLKEKKLVGRWQGQRGGGPRGAGLRARGGLWLHHRRIC
jgi:hypothetical protein